MFKNLTVVIVPNHAFVAPLEILKFVQENIRDVSEKPKNDSTSANHLMECNLSFDDNFEILYVDKNYLKMRLLEFLEINPHENGGNL